MSIVYRVSPSIITTNRALSQRSRLWSKSSTKVLTKFLCGVVDQMLTVLKLVPISRPKPMDKKGAFCITKWLADIHHIFLNLGKYLEEGKRAVSSYRESHRLRTHKTKHKIECILLKFTHPYCLQIAKEIQTPDFGCY